MTTAASTKEPLVTRVRHVANCRTKIKQAARVEMGMLGGDSGPYYARISKSDASRLIGEAGFDLMVFAYTDGVAVLQPGPSPYGEHAPDAQEAECPCCEGLA